MSALVSPERNALFPLQAPFQIFWAWIAPSTQEEDLQVLILQDRRRHKLISLLETREGKSPVSGKIRVALY